MVARGAAAAPGDEGGRGVEVAHGHQGVGVVLADGDQDGAAVAADGTHDEVAELGEGGAVGDGAGATRGIDASALDLDGWETKTSLSRSMYASMALLVGSTVWLLGGQEGNTQKDSIYLKSSRTHRVAHDR